MGDSRPGHRAAPTADPRLRAGRVSDATVDEIARRVVELLQERVPGRYADTATVARSLGVSSEWVRDHAGELGAIRIGDGPRGPLRFDLRRVEQALERRRVGQPSVRRGRRPGPRQTSRGVRPAAIPTDVRSW